MKMALNVVMILVLTLATVTPGVQPADLVLHNGKVLVMDEAFTVHSALAIRDGRIVATGDESLVQEFWADRTIDLKGRTAMPGFIDTHIHIGGDSHRHIDLSKTKSIRQLQDQVREMAGKLGPGEWITGSAWSEDVFEERRRPLRADLDEAAPDNPVILTRAGGHSSVASSLALGKAGITSDTPDPEGGIIEKDAGGEPNGILRERASGLVRRLVPPATEEEVRNGIVNKLRSLLEMGITSIIVAGVGPERFRLWESIYRGRRSFGLPRVTLQLRPAIADGNTDRAFEALRAFGKKSGDGNSRFRVGALKVSVDGGYTGAAAWTLEPYPGQPDHFGRLLVSDQELYSLSKAAHEMGWQLGYHAIGDAAIQLTVDVFARILEESPRDDHRHYLNHFTVMPPEQTFRKMRRHNILVAQQPNFTYTLEGRYRANLEGERLARNNPLHTLFEEGILTALGSDVLPIGPMVGLYAAVTRKGMSGRVYAPQERLTLPEALAAYTRAGAYFSFEEDFKGTLEKGKVADVIVLDRDILSTPEEEILETKVEMTLLGGFPVHPRPAPRRP